MKLKLNCKKCGKEFSGYPCDKDRKFCSRKCFEDSRVYVRTKEKNNLWKGGRPKCPDCGKLIKWDSLRCRKCYDKFYTGSMHHSWKGGITSERIRIWQSPEYKLWRRSVFERDNFTCRFCGIRGVPIQADHIKRFAEYPELRFAIDNGRTLCVPCHRKTHNWGTTGMSMKELRLKNKHEKI